jgi:PPOX class probable F420-dependent enzyme
MATIPDSHKDLLSDEARTFAFLATTMKNGAPQVTPVWFSWDGSRIWINSARGRTKDRNMRNRPYVAIAIPDTGNPYRYLQIRGKVVSITEIGAEDHIDHLSLKYTGKMYPKRPGEVRVIYQIEPEEITANG